MELNRVVYFIMEITSANEFIRQECAVWSEEYIFDLIERGYEPTQLTNPATGAVKWSWRFTPLDNGAPVCYVQTTPPVTSRSGRRI